MGWTRKGRKGAFLYYDSRGREIADPVQIERIEKLAIPPAWGDVSISPRLGTKLQATGHDKAGRKPPRSRSPSAPAVTASRRRRPTRTAPSPP